MVTNYMYVALANNGMFFSIEESWIPEGETKEVSLVDTVEEASLYYYKSDIEDLIAEYNLDDM